MNPRNDEAPTAGTVRASDDSTPSKGIGTVKKLTTPTRFDEASLIEVNADIEGAA